MRSILFLPVFFGVAVVGGSSCNADNECASICDVARNCRNSNINSESCADRCSSEADASDAFRDDVEACDDCLGDDCSNDPEFCRVECANVIEVSSGVSFDVTDNTAQ